MTAEKTLTVLTRINDDAMARVMNADFLDTLFQKQAAKSAFVQIPSNHPPGQYNVAVWI